MKISAFAALSTVFVSTVQFASWAAEIPSPNTIKPVTKVSDLFDDPVIVRGKGVEVKRSQVEDAFIAFAANLAARGHNLAEDQRPVREAQLLDRLVITRLLVNRATEPDRTRARELSEKFIADARRSATSEETFRRQLKAAGMSQEAFTNRVME